jgi:hypothetical protein
MNSWINLTALWKIVVVGLLAGAGLPALFAVGLRALSLGSSAATVLAGVDPAAAGTEGGEGGQPQTQLVGGNPLGIAAAALCFAVVLAAIGWGIYSIVNHS